jgi:hypothetical protein
MHTLAVAGRLSRLMADVGRTDRLARLRGGHPGLMAGMRAPLAVGTALSSVFGVLLLLSTACTSRGPAAARREACDFTQTLSTGDSVGTCFLSYRFVAGGGDSGRDSVRVAWTCRLDLPGTIYPCRVGGILEFDLSGPNGVVATDRAATGGMEYGREYTFSGTVAVPVGLAVRLEPSWRLTCEGKPMSFVTCGPIRRIEE